MQADVALHKGLTAFEDRRRNFKVCIASPPEKAVQEAWLIQTLTSSKPGRKVGRKEQRIDNTNKNRKMVHVTPATLEITLKLPSDSC